VGGHLFASQQTGGAQDQGSGANGKDVLRISGLATNERESLFVIHESFLSRASSHVQEVKLTYLRKSFFCSQQQSACVS
jgi:hypothetical protein